MKYKICSYELQDGRWGPAFLLSPSVGEGKMTVSEPTQFDIYFPTKKEADVYARDHLIEKGVSEEDIIVQDAKEGQTKEGFVL